MKAAVAAGFSLRMNLCGIQNPLRLSFRKGGRGKQLMAESCFYFEIRSVFPITVRLLANMAETAIRGLMIPDMASGMARAL